MSAADPIVIQPRLLTERQAATYLNVPAAEIARLQVGRICLGKRVRFDRLALDAHLDAQSGLARNMAPQQDDGPEAALERFREAQRHAAGRS